jgi:hypothetical protein
MSYLLRQKQFHHSEHDAHGENRMRLFNNMREKPFAVSAVFAVFKLLNHFPVNTFTRI